MTNVDLIPEPKFIIILWGVIASYGVGLKSAQAWGCPCSIKCILKDIRSGLTPSLHLLSTIPFPIGSFEN